MGTRLYFYFFFGLNQIHSPTRLNNIIKHNTQPPDIKPPHLSKCVLDTGDVSLLGVPAGAAGGPGPRRPSVQALVSS